MVFFKTDSHLSSLPWSVQKLKLKFTNKTKYSPTVAQVKYRKTINKQIFCDIAWRNK